MPTHTSITPQSSLTEQMAYLDAFMEETDGDNNPAPFDDGTPRDKAVRALREARDLLEGIVSETDSPDTPDTPEGSDLSSRLTRIEARLAAIEEFFG